MMRAIVVYAFAITVVCGAVFCDDRKEDIAGQKILPEKANVKNDLSSAASGYIFRSDGDNPPIFIKLGPGNIERGDGVLKKPDLNFPIVKKQPHKETFPILTKKTKPFESHNEDDEDDIFKEAFKNIPPPAKKQHAETEEDFPILTNIHKYKSTEEIENYDIKNVPGEIPEISEEHDDYKTDDYKTPEDIDVPHTVTHYESEEHEESPYFEDDKFAYPKKAYVAPLYKYPHPQEVQFNSHKAPVKYDLKPKKKSKSSFNTETSYHNPADINTSVENFEGEDLNEYSARYTHGDYHYKPEKHKFAKGGGESYKEDHHSSHGEKGDKGYKKYHDFDEGEMGHHGKEGKKGFYEDEHGYKKSHHDEGDKYGEHHGEGYGEKGAKYGESGGHKKGHKTSGYHNIFHKDEYKKEHKFYDDAHKHGYLDKHGSYDKHHGKKHGHKASGGFHDSAFDHGHKGNSGHYKKGHFDQDHKGHKGKSGHESYYSHHDDYGKKSGHSDSEKHGFHHGH